SAHAGTEYAPQWTKIPRVASWAQVDNGRDCGIDRLLWNMLWLSPERTALWRESSPAQNRSWLSHHTLSWWWRALSTRGPSSARGPSVTSPPGTTPCPWCPPSGTLLAAIKSIHP